MKKIIFCLLFAQLICLRQAVSQVKEEILSPVAYNHIYAQISLKCDEHKIIKTSVTNLITKVDDLNDIFSLTKESDAVVFAIGTKNELLLHSHSGSAAPVM